MNPFTIRFNKAHAFVLKLVLSQVAPSKVEEFERKAAPLVDKVPLHEVIGMTRKMTDPAKFDQALERQSREHEKEHCMTCPIKDNCPKMIRGS